MEEGLTLGLGKQAEDDRYTAPESVQRKRLETEIQADEAEERKERREARHMRERDLSRLRSYGLLQSHAGSCRERRQDQARGSRDKKDISVRGGACVMGRTDCDGKRGS